MKTAFLWVVGVAISFYAMYIFIDRYVYEQCQSLKTLQSNKDFNPAQTTIDACKNVGVEIKNNL